VRVLKVIENWGVFNKKLYDKASIAYDNLPNNSPLKLLTIRAPQNFQFSPKDGDLDLPPAILFAIASYSAFESLSA